MELINKYTALRARFLNNCPRSYGEPCGGDTSVGIEPCAYFRDIDIDENEKILPSGCLLEMEQECGEPCSGEG